MDASPIKNRRTILILLLASLGQLAADQPIMNMMPRWDGGYGFQVLAESIHRSDLKQGDDVVASGYSEDLSILHLQGVYTWDRSVRLTFKLPYIMDVSEVPGSRARRLCNTTRGWVTSPLPSAQTILQPSCSQRQLDLTPQVRVPLGKPTTVTKLPTASGVVASSRATKRRPTTGSLLPGSAHGSSEIQNRRSGTDLGWNALDYLQILWESDLHWDDDDAFIVSAGPAIYARFSDNVHARFEWKYDFVSEVSSHEPDHGNGDRLSIGIGFVF